MKKLTFWKSLFLLCALIVGSVNGWAEESTWTWTAASSSDLGSTSTATGSSANVTLNGKSWTSERKLISGESYSGFTSSCIQLGKNGGVDNVTLTTSAFSGNVIKSVAVECSSYQGNHSIAIKVGSSTYLSATATSSWTTVSTKTGTGTSQGDIEIKFTGGTRALYIKSITVKYEPASTDPAINASNVEIYDDATNGSIAYTINHAVEGGVLTAARTVEADTWLTVGEVTSTTVPFTTTVNTGEERSTTVRLTYTYDTDKTVTKDVTVTQSAPITKYTVTINSPTGGTLVVKHGETTVNTGDRFPEGTVLNITATADERYKFRNWQAVDASTHTYTASNTGNWTMTAHDVTFRANFDEREYHNANFSVNGTVTAVEYENGATINFPANPEDINGTKFVGWSATTIEGTTNTKPAFVKSAKMGDADVTFYAVFAAAEGDGVETITYEKLTSNSFDADATYVIGAMNGNNLALFYDYSTVDSEASWGKMSTNYTNNAPLTFTLSGTASSLYVKDNNGNYLQGKVNNFRMVSENNKSAITLANDGTMHDVQSANNTERWLRYNTSTDCGLRWYATTSTTGNIAYFYKIIVDPGYTYSSYCTTVPTTGTITLNAACHDGNGTIYGTFYTNRAYVMPENVEGQVVSVDDEGKLEVYDAYDPGDVVPAFTALLLYTIDEFTGTKDYTITYSTGGDDYSDYNMLKGTLTASETTTGDNCLFYRLTMHNGTTIGFYWGAENGAAFTPGANKAYLAVPTQQAAKMGFAFNENVANSINNVAVEPIDENAPIYNLAGQRVNKSFKGIVIQNGKKMLNK